MYSDDPIDGFTQAIEPKRILTIWMRVLLCIILVGAGITITRMSWLRFNKIDNQDARQLVKEEIVSLKRDWFVAKLEEINGLKHQLKTSKEAFASAEQQRKATWISRESDREIYNVTLNRVLATENALLIAIKEYNTAAAITNSAEIAGLTSSVSID